LITSCQSGGLSNRPRLGFNFPLKIFKAVLLPIPLEPTKPRTCPGRGVGSLWSLKLFAEYRCVTWDSRLVGRLMILIAPKGHFLGQIPHPMHKLSDMNAIFDVGVTSIQRRPLRTTGQDFLHSCLHFYGRMVNVRLLTRRLPVVYLWLALQHGRMLLAYVAFRGGVFGGVEGRVCAHLIRADNSNTGRLSVRVRLHPRRQAILYCPAQV